MPISIVFLNYTNRHPEFISGSLKSTTSIRPNSTTILLVGNAKINFHLLF